MHDELKQIKKLSTKEIEFVNKTRTKDNLFHETLVILNNIRSMHNVGAFFRTADALGIRKLFLCGITPTPPRPEISKSALGADEFVNWEKFDNTIHLVEQLKKENFQIIGLEQTNRSIPLDRFTPEKDQKYALIFGNEVTGIDQDLLNFCNKIIEIPQFGNKHSFNVSVSFGIVCYTLFERFKNF